MGGFRELPKLTELLSDRYGFILKLRLFPPHREASLSQDPAKGALALQSCGVS